jgi:hypothetical protein
MAKPESCAAEFEHDSGLGELKAKHFKFKIENLKFSICNPAIFHTSNPPTEPLRFSKLQRASTYRNERGDEPRSSFFDSPTRYGRLACIFTAR